MKTLFAAIVALIATPIFAHSGHIERLDGHAHTLAELAVMGAVPFVLGLMLVSALFWVKAHRND